MNRARALFEEEMRKEMVPLSDSAPAKPPFHHTRAQLQVIYTAAHGGFLAEGIALGGGAAVCDALIREWSEDERIALTVIGPGSGSGYESFKRLRYVRLPVLPEGARGKDLVHLSERAYACFCRRFEGAITEFLRQEARQKDPTKICVLSNDVAEGGSFWSIAQMGYRIFTIFHVDVVDFFSRMYLGDVFGPRRLVQLHRGLHHAGLARFLPDIFRLVFEKQQECVEASSRIILPSQEVAETLRGCYGDDVQQKLAVIPWGSWDEGVSQEAIEEETLGLQRRYGVHPDETVLLTLSRLSPEKGIDLLLEALRMWELEEPPQDLRLFICGDAAFMQGKKYQQKLLRQARRLKRVRVDFPGHVTGTRKGAFFALAHIYVFPSRHESYGLTLVEALRAGLPVLSSNHYGVREILRPECGEIVNLRGPGAASRLLGVLKRMVRDRELLRRMGPHARRAAETTNFSEAAKALASLMAQKIR